MDLIAKFSLAGLLFLLTLVFGFWLSRVGKPYNAFLFNFHKLIALGGVIFTIWQLTQLLNGINPSAVLIVLVAAAALGMISLFGSGALMSAGKLNYRVMLSIHHSGPVVLTVAIVLAVYLLGSQP